ncbi:hypothetical protein CALVIDRAFT_183593 [Calocera viscosa TUFC12733]|uniref:Uncharacterized protein n=1 Tax=Calocera viscosa (strain TUFC12733) TaxID=1330018 RepID=A0A167L2G4_CALVF|nr:hypothetical protein CALVIDRAFT_183593 [Calocera viscosa TUFC12733]
MDSGGVRAHLNYAHICFQIFNEGVRQKKECKRYLLVTRKRWSTSALVDASSERPVVLLSFGKKESASAHCAPIVVHQLPSPLKEQLPRFEAGGLLSNMDNTGIPNLRCQQCCDRSCNRQRLRSTLGEVAGAVRRQQPSPIARGTKSVYGRKTPRLLRSGVHHRGRRLGLALQPTSAFGIAQGTRCRCEVQVHVSFILLIFDDLLLAAFVRIDGLRQGEN